MLTPMRFTQFWCRIGCIGQPEADGEIESLFHSGRKLQTMIVQRWESIAAGIDISIHSLQA